MPFEITPRSMPEDFLMDIAKAVGVEPGTDDFDKLLAARGEFAKTYSNARDAIDVAGPYFHMRTACILRAAALLSIT